MATVDQQRELMQYTRRLDDWMGREVGERHGDLSRLRALFEQIRQDVRDWQDGRLDLVFQDLEFAQQRPQKKKNLHRLLPAITQKQIFNQASHHNPPLECLSICLTRHCDVQ